MENKDNNEKKEKSILNKFPFSLKPDLSMFEPATDDEKRQQERMRSSSSFFKDGLRRLVKNPVSMVCLCVVVTITLIAFLVPLFYPYKYEETTANSYASGFLSPNEYSIREQILRTKNEDVVLMGWSYMNEETYNNNKTSYGGLKVIDSQEYLDEVKHLFVTDKVDLSNGSVTLFAVWGIDKNHDGVADFGADLFNSYTGAATVGARYNVTYDLNGGTGTLPVDTISYAKGDAVVPERKTSEEIKRDGYVFLGWSNELVADVTETNYKDVESQLKKVVKGVDVKGDITFYAVWGVDSNLDGKTDNFTMSELTYKKTKLNRSKINYDMNMGEGTKPADATEYATTDTGYAIDASTVNFTKQYVKVFPHIFGTDQLGRDYAIRVMVGTKISLLVGIIAAVMVVIVGVLYGAISGYFGGRVDMIMMRIVDIIYSLPDTLIIILFSVSLGDIIKQSSFATTATKLGGTGMVSILIVFAMLYWVGMARLVRGQVLSLREQEYVLAAKAIGAKPFKIIFKHMLPNCLSVIIISAALQIPSAIFTESTLSFLGVGVSEPMPSLGSLASSGRGYMSIASQRFLFFIPAIVIFLIVLSLNLLGQGLRDAFDPKIRVRGGSK